MKPRIKSLKLQDVTKALTRDVKNQFLVNAVQRILRADRTSIVGGVSFKRRRILTVLASTFTKSVRDEILSYILQDVQKRLDLAFSWLYEEYSLFQGE
jgi:symplekin